MADEPGTDVVSTWLRRASPVIDLVGKLGLTTVLILIVALGVGWATGYLPLKPFDDQRADHAALLKETRDTGAATVAALTAMLAALKEQNIILSGMALRNQLVDCDKLKTPDVRARCFSATPCTPPGK